MDLGPTVDRLYPRGATFVSSGGSAMAVGRIRNGLPPTSVVVRYRRGGRLVEETRLLDRVEPAKSSDVRRRWAQLRVEDIVRHGQSIEVATDLAVRAKLLTPWTGFYVPGATSSGLEDRIFDPNEAAALAPGRAGVRPEARIALLEPHTDAPPSEENFDDLVTASTRRTLVAAMPRVRRCRDARVALRPEIGGTLIVHLQVDGKVHASAVRVRAADPADDDPALDRCVETLVATLPFFDSDTRTTVTVEHRLELPPPRNPRATRCSQTSALPVALRRTVWRERLDRSGDSGTLYLDAKRACELSGWTDERTLLESMLDRTPTGEERIALAARLDALGENDAAAYVRRSAVDRAVTPEDLAAVRRALIGEEPLPGPTFYKQYAAAEDDESRLVVVRRFLQLSPHDPTLRRALFALLESLGHKDALVQAIYDVRQDPFADAALLADGASALRRVGLADEGVRAFGELVERAPGDPYARAYVGDRLRAEGLWDDATLAYQALDRLLPGDPAAALRLALAHAGAGRLDVATRVLDRVSQTGGRSDDAGLGELASMTSAVLLADAKGHATGEVAEELTRRALEVPLPDLAGVVLVRTTAIETAIEPRLVHGTDDHAEAAPDLAAPSMGLYALRLERGDHDVRIRIRRPAETLPSRAASVRIAVLSIADDRSTRLTEKEVTLIADGKDAELRWDGGAIL
jgi:Flp pilus assembly protein TadD